jgi:hypothetical protein
MHFFSLFTFLTLAHVLIITGVSIRIITMRLPVTVSLAWLILVFFLPLVGAIAYLVLGEKRLGPQFADRTRAIKARYDGWLRDLPPEIRSDTKGLSPKAQSISRLVHYTCRSYFDDMLSAGIRIFGFKGGLLHTKSVVVDRQVALFGSVNLDVRSFWLDFEVTLAVYDPDFAERLLALQDRYIEDSAPVDPQTWQQRSGKERFMENLARLASPLL